jgi:hypothetical protein
MKKILALAVLALLLTTTGCNVTQKVTNEMGIPSKVSYLEFCNGGVWHTFGGEGLGPVKVETRTEFQSRATGADISFYKYYVKDPKDGQVYVFIDSESLSIMYQEYSE